MPTTETIYVYNGEFQRLDEIPRGTNWGDISIKYGIPQADIKEFMDTRHALMFAKERTFIYFKTNLIKIQHHAHHTA